MTRGARSSTPTVDEAERRDAVHERARNLIIDAGAGTGKTTTLVERIVEAVAPQAGGRALSMSRIAAVTFTRKAAGELKLRLRERLLDELAGGGADNARAELLHAALGALDTAHVATIHSFTDRLLRRFPVEARLSPVYEIAEDAEAYEREAASILLRAAQDESLEATLDGLVPRAVAREAQSTVLDALKAGVPAESREGPHRTTVGLIGLVSALLQSRDVPLEPPAPARYDPAPFERARAALVSAMKNVSRETFAGERLHGVTRELRRVNASDPAEVLHAVKRARRLPKMQKGLECGGDEDTWAAYNALKNGKEKSARRGEAEPSWFDVMVSSAARWLSTRLVRLRPVVVALYDRVKRRHGVVDPIDLLLRLRDLLQRDLRVRAECQSLFDHVLVDEFQDTDPLQAEIVLYLCEEKPRAKRWTDVMLAKGKLTIVGDPKQSIYRFRRADIAMYDRVREIVSKSGPRVATLSVNFRSRPALIDFCNERMASILGAVESDGTVFDRESGEVRYKPLVAGVVGDRSPGVHLLPLECLDAKPSAEAVRAVEANAVANYLRWMVAERSVEVRDPSTRSPRPAHYGDVAVLAMSTSHLAPLFEAFDRMGIPYVARGGKLFLQDEWHRRFVLGLCAIADSDDGVAMAAILRPPFFAVDVGDLLAERAASRGAGVERVARVERAESVEGVERAREAIEFVRALRARRFDRPPGSTARDLLEQTAFARHLALGPNGAQRVERLRELCAEVDRIAAREACDYDAATARMRAWIDDPVKLDPPTPVSMDAVQVLTVHQAKGLEWPVVLLWDARQQMRPHEHASAFRVDREGAAWRIEIDGCAHEEPPTAALGESEKKYAAAERKRLLYVAATRARDRLVVPIAGTGNAHVNAALVGDGCHAAIERMGPFTEGRGAPWSSGIEPVAEREIPPASADDDTTNEAFAAAARTSAKTEFRRTGVAAFAAERAGASMVESGTLQTHAETAEMSDLVADSSEGASDIEAAGVPAGTEQRARPSRFGPVFGATVHRAIEWAVRQKNPDVAAAVEQASRGTAVRERLDATSADVARADVARTIAALEREGLRGDGVVAYTEYPVAGRGPEGTLLSGSIDYVAVRDGHVDVIDFKTDAAPIGDVGDAAPAYVAQVKLYAELIARGLAAAGTLTIGRVGLLYTEDGIVRWVG